MKFPQICYEGEGTGSPPPAATPPAGPWYQGKADAEVIGHWQTRGWADKSPEEIAIEATKAHRGAEKLIGAPADQVVRLPTDPNDAAGWSKVWQRLGAPADGKDYDLSGVKRAGDQPLSPEFEAAVRGALKEAGVSKTVAPSLVNGIVKYLDSVEQAKTTEAMAKLTEERAALEKNWGTNMAVNKAIAANAAKNLGLSPEVVDTLEKTVGYKATMEALLTLGIKTGEARFIQGTGNTQGGMLSREQAIARKAELMADTQWRKDYVGGKTEAVREMVGLNTIISGGTLEGDLASHLKPGMRR